MTEQEKLKFIQLGSFIESGKICETDNVKYASVNKDHSLDRTLARKISEFVDIYSTSENKLTSLTFKKVANTSDENWSSFEDEIIECWTKTAAPIMLSALPIATAGLGLATSVVNSAPRVVESTVPLISSSTGKSLVEAERLINER